MSALGFADSLTRRNAPGKLQHYPRAGNGRPPTGVECMLRMHLLANSFNLAAEACEDAL